ncbi:D-alanine-D-alanine ligase [Bacillus pakistanensis]|uniref:D-alanine--D-alanine ligase n=1 Tax=Rossellomorea pakistanensis TaxID=992288 RepID=A0ABS2NJV2_9BACI|nr:D-alanine--D-alanine ligase [Bacillus pakistanensis]MBM7588034.1 D-alanine-D-alanine ligase [Bacillus pakistanensis]
MKTKLCLLYGGKSAEHKVSLQTAKAVIGALDADKFDVFPIYISTEGEWIKGPQLQGPVEDIKVLEYKEGEAIAPNALSTTLSTANSTGSESYDVIFPLLHGPNGEDGTVQGMLDLLNLPYVGNGVLSSAAGMDKVIMKNLFAQAGIPQVDYVWFTRRTWEKEEDQAYEIAEKEIGYPCFVKPANLGSSVGISKCTNREELAVAFKEAFQFDRKIIIEQGVKAREIELGVLGNDDPQCSVAGEIVPKKDFYDYKAKYEDGDTALIIPAEISEGIYEKMKEIAIDSFKALDCSGLVRADFFLTEDGQIYMNEVNTMPGFTPFSMFPLLWKHTGVEYPQLIEKLVTLALERHEDKQNIKHTM